MLQGGTSPGATVDPEALAKQAAMARLGIAVLSSFARLPELAGSEDMVEKLPLFLKVCLGPYKRNHAEYLSEAMSAPEPLPARQLSPWLASNCLLHAA